jgi:hypothetical protein
MFMLAGPPGGRVWSRTNPGLTYECFVSTKGEAKQSAWLSLPTT